MKKTLLIIFSFLITFQLSACKRDVPEPELESISRYSLKAKAKRPVFANNISKNKQNNFTVNYHVNNQDVFVECIVKNITFRNDGLDNNDGKLIVYINGERVKEVNGATFVLKSLPKGRHKIKLEVVNMKNIPYGISKQFTVNI